MPEARARILLDRPARGLYIHRRYREDGAIAKVKKPESLLPLTPAVFHILLSLAGGERHGYAIMQEVAELTDGAIRLGPGTLYRSIKQMLGDRLIQESDERPDPELDDERRRYYRLSSFGLRVSRAEAQRLAQVVQVARQRRLLEGWRPSRAGAR